MREKKGLCYAAFVESFFLSLRIVLMFTTGASLIEQVLGTILLDFPLHDPDDENRDDHERGSCNAYNGKKQLDLLPQDVAAPQKEHDEDGRPQEHAGVIPQRRHAHRARNK